MDLFGVLPMNTIKAVLRRMSFQDFVSLAEQTARLTAANERMAAIENAEKRTKINREKVVGFEILRLGRPEYVYLKNARAKAARYRKHIAFARFERDRKTKPTNGVKP